ncbi:MAG: glutathione S-transferase N-terminal domain-containing protein [Marinagarivorans sp.]|nr:glutathione S-transferase N-terminal domain-containing protein [Marinagarivorans sp.]
MELFGYINSPFVRHVCIALAETQLPYTFNTVDGDISAKLSPTKKVPFLQDGKLLLSDSTSILRHIREQAGQPFLATVQDLDAYCLINTLMDSTINLFLLERSGVSFDGVTYIERQQKRILEGLEHLNQLNICANTYDHDVVVRLQCFLIWALFRNRFTVDGHTNLQTLIKNCEHEATFIATRPQA